MSCHVKRSGIEFTLERNWLNASQKPISVDKVIFVSLEKLFYLRENCREETALGCVIKTKFNRRASWIHRY